MLGTRTRGGRMVGADESTELWRHPIPNGFLFDRKHMGQPRPLFCLFSSFSQHSDKYSTKFGYKQKKHFCVHEI